MEIDLKVPGHSHPSFSETQPFFSIIMPAYNRAKFLPQAIQSVLDQHYENWELIIIDDGSKDNTREVVSAFTDKRVRYFYQQNQERSVSRNNGIAKAQGKYICFLDSDDYYLNNHLQVLHNEISLRSFPVAFFYTGGLEDMNGKMVKRAIYENKEEHPLRFVFFNFLLPNSVCIHKDAFEKHKFIPDQTVLEDINLWMRILSEYPFFQISEYTTVRVTHDDQSAKRFFKDVDLRIIESYVDNISHIFKYSDAYKYITEQERKEFIKKRYIRVCYNAAWSSNYNSLWHILKKTIRLSPGFLFEKTFFKIVKEGLIRSLKDIKLSFSVKSSNFKSDE